MVIGLFLYIRDRAWILERTLKSILEQSYDTKKIHLKLIFNDCKDNSKEIAEDFKTKNLPQFLNIEIFEWNFGAEEDDRRDFHKRRLAMERMVFLKNRMFNSFINSENIPDKIMFFDSDIILDKNAIQRMVEANKDIIAGVVKTHPTRINNYNYLFLNEFDKTHNRNKVINGLERVDHVSGFTMFDKKTFNEIMFGTRINGASDDDLAMDIARANGFEIWADTNITGNHVMNRD